MKAMKKRWQTNSVSTVIVILALALGIGGGMFGLLSAADLLLVKAEQTAEASPGETVSPVDTTPVDTNEVVSPADGAKARKKSVGRTGQVLFAQADPDPVEIPLIVTHDIEMNDGRTVTTAYPSGWYSDVTGVARSVISSETQLEVPFDRSVASSQPGVFYYGHDLTIYLHGLTANYSNQWGYWFNGSVNLNLSDGSSINWPLGTGYGRSYFGDTTYEGTFYWNAISDQIGDRTVTSISVNQINSFPRPSSLQVVRHTTVPIKIESLNTQSAWDGFYSEVLPQYGNSGLTEPENVRIGISSLQFGEDDESASFGTYMMKGGRFVVSSLSDTVHITELRLYDSSGNAVTGNYVTKSEGQFIVDYPHGLIVDVYTSDMTPHKVTVEATSEDFSLHTVAVADSYTSDNFYSVVYKQRFSDEDCTTALSNGTQYARNSSNSHTSEDGKTVSFANYHMNQNANWYMSLICYDRSPDTYISSNSNNAQITEISDVRFIKDSTGEDITSAIEYRLAYKSGSPYVQFKPPAYDVTVKIKQTIKLSLHSISVYETRPSTDDYIWRSYVTYYEAGVYSTGDASTAPNLSNDSVFYGNNANPSMAGTEELVQKKYRYVDGKKYKYTLNFTNDFSTWIATVKSVHVYKAKADGTPDFDQNVDSEVGLSYQAPENAYLTYAGSNQSPIFSSKVFTMPAYDICIHIDFGTSLASCKVEQKISKADGTIVNADDKFSVTFKGVGLGDTDAFVGGNEITLANGESETYKVLGIHRKLRKFSFTTSPDTGYVVSKVEMKYAGRRAGVNTNSLTRNGNDFTVADSALTNDSQNPPFSNITITYTKVAQIRVNQKADGTVVPEGETLVGSVTFDTQNSGSFVDPSSTASNNLASTYTSKLVEGDTNGDGKIANTAVVETSAGNKLKIKIKVNTSSSRVLSKVAVRRTNSDTPLDMTLKSSKYDSMEYWVNEPLADNDDITVDVEYMTANHIKVEVLEKNPNTSNSMMTNTTDAYAEVVGTGASTTERGYQFINSDDRAVTCDSFTVQNTLADYLTVGQTKLSIEVKDVPEGYVVANVDAAYINESGRPGEAATGLMPSSQNLDGYGICYDYSKCTINTAERNLYIRVFLAKTADVTVRFRSRTDFDDAVFEDNTVSNTYATFEHTNSNYGSGTIYPVIVENDSGSKYNTAAYTVTNNPSVRHVYAIDRVSMSGTISMPKEYTIASVTATRSKDGTTETLTPQLSGYTYKTENGVEVYQAKFALSDQLCNGYAYDITVNIEKVTTVELKMYHSNENGAFVLNQVTDSIATLHGSRSEESAPYNQTVYQSDVPFHHMTQNNVAPTGSVTVVKNTPQATYYVLRHTTYTVAVKPADIDSVYEVKAYEPDGDTYDCTYTETDANGNLIYTVTQNGTPKKSEMNHKMVFEVYFADKRTEGTVTVENRDFISGELIENPGQISLTLSNALYSKPAKNLSDGTQVGGSVSVTGSRAQYSIVTGTKTKLYTSGAAWNRLYAYSVQYDDGEVQTNTMSESKNSYDLTLNVTADGQVKVVNYFIKASGITLSAHYGDIEEAICDARTDMRNKSQYDSLFISSTAKKDGETVAVTNLSTSTWNNKYLITGESSDYTLTIKELPGYTLSKLVLRCSGTGEWVLTRDQITSEAVPESGANLIEFDVDSLKQGSLSDEQFALLKQSFASLKGLNDYSVQATFTANFIHVFAYEMSYDEYLEMQEMGYHAYLSEHGGLGYHSARRVANVGNYSVDGSINDIYFKTYSSEYAMGVRTGSNPTCVVNYQYRVTRSSSSDYYEYYRLGAVYYGSSVSTQSRQYIGTNLPLPVGFGASFSTGTITDDSYLTVIYVRFTEEDIKTPEVKEENYSSEDTVVKNTKLTVNLYRYDDETDGYVAITDAAMLEEIAATLKVKQTCVGYHYESSSESAKYSDSENHANYVPPSDSTDENDVPVVYRHDSLPMLYQYDWEQGAFVSVMDALIADEMDGVVHPTGETAKEATVSIASANTLYAVKSNSIDKVHVYLNANVPATYNLEKMEINSNGTVATKSDNCAYDYETAAGGNITVSYYFSRPILEVGTNNETNAAKGTVSLGDKVVIKDTDYMQAVGFLPGDTIDLTIVPNDGYEFDYIRAGSSRSGDMAYVPAEQITQTVNEDGKTVTTVHLGEQNRNVYIQLQFRNEVQEDLALLTVNQFKYNSSGEAIPITDGKVVITGTGSSSEVLRVGDTRGTRLTLTDASSLSANVLAGTKLDFSLQAPEGYTLADSPFVAGFQEKGDNTVHAISPEHADNSVVYTVPVSYVQTDRAITVNVYFAPQYRLIYDGNNHTGGTPPTDDNYYPSGRTLTEFAGRHTLERTGYRFDGWSLSKTEPEQVTEVTFGDENITLYAIWVPKNTYTVTYHGAGHTGGNVPVDAHSPYYEGDTVYVLNKGSLVKVVDDVPYVFKGWDTDPSADEVVYVPYDSSNPPAGSSFVIHQNTDLYAVWKAQYTVTYDGKGHTGGTVPTDDNNPYEAGATVRVLDKGDMVKSVDGVNYVFQGWDTDPSGTTVRYTAYDGENPAAGSFAIQDDTTLYAVWTAQYTVTYDGKGHTGGTVPTDDNNPYEAGATVQVLDKGDMVKSVDGVNYVFMGWDTDPLGTTVRYTAYDDANPTAGSFAIQANTTFYAVWKARYTVTYDGNGSTGGTAPTDADSPYDGGENVTVLEKGSLTKVVGGVPYRFRGWSETSGENNNVQYEPGDTFAIHANTTLYAVWEARYTVTYDGNGATAGQAPTDENNPYDSGADVTVLGKGDLVKVIGGVPCRFKGWSETSGENNTVQYAPGNTFAIHANTTLYAVWRKQYTVTYDGNGATDGEAPEDGSSPYESGAEVTVLDKGNLKKTGYTFQGWSKTAGEDNSVQYAADSTFAITENTTLYAVWKINTHKVIYSLTVPDDVNFTYQAEETFDYGASVPMQTKPTPSDYHDPLKYTFHGWDNTDTDLNMNAAQTQFVMPDHDVTFTGYFTENGQSTLTYNANGGQPADKVPQGESKYGKIETTVKDMPSECVKTGHSFDHWNTAQDGSGTGYAAGAAIEVPEGETKVLYAQWRVNSYPVEYYDIDGYSEGKTPLKTDLYPYEDVTSIGAQAPDVNGKKFRQWVLVDGSQTDANDATIGERTSFPMPGQPVRYKAVYDDLQYQVVYVYSDTAPEGAADVPTDNALYAFGNSVNAAPVPTVPAGYSFNGWLLGGSKTTGFTIDTGTPTTPVEGNELLYTITLTGVWSRNSDVNITYTSGLSGDDITDESLRNVRYDTCTKGQDYTVKHNEGFTDYVRPGYEFAGWKVVTSGSQPNPGGWLMAALRAVAPVFFHEDTVYEEGATIPALSSDITLAAVWKQNAAPTYTVTYHGNENTSGDPPVDTEQYTAGSTATVKGRNTLQKTGFDFDCWATEPTGGGDHYSEGASMTVNGDIHLYAKWKTSGDDSSDQSHDSYRVFYDGNGATGGDVPEDHTLYAPDSSATVLHQGNLSKNGCTFVGWNTQADGKGKTYQAGDHFTMGSSNVTLYAMWRSSVTISSPGTGESAWMLATAIAAMILSAAAVVAVIWYRKRKA